MAKDTVNLDAMILRADFAEIGDDSETSEQIQTIALRDFTDGSVLGPNLRKPDFQRETSHWSPAQVFSLLDSFVNGDLIPSVILWKSPTNVFVIDGGHRLSALRGWIEDDYGDGPISKEYFDSNIPAAQKKAAEKTRKLIDTNIGSYKHVVKTLSMAGGNPEEKKKFGTIITRALPIQWVKGNAEKAETSFFKINTAGTPIDDIEELLLRTRHKPISIATRAIIRAATGHKYWSAFDDYISQQIEDKAKVIHNLLFEPEISSPIKTLNLPLGGAKAVRTALTTLLRFSLIACRNREGVPKNIKDLSDDSDGSQTTKALDNIMELTQRITGNIRGSLGLHPAVYFYGPSGQHQAPMFMGTALLFKSKLLNNDSNFFKTFIHVRETLENTLIEHKHTIAKILSGYGSSSREDKYAGILNGLINHLKENKSISIKDIIELSGLEGTVVVGEVKTQAADFSKKAKSEAFIKKALGAAIKCPICNGYLDVEKSVSYDHIQCKRDGGKGTSENCELTHPFCNNSRDTLQG